MSFSSFRVTGVCRSAVILSALIPLVCHAQVSGWIENQSYTTLCAEVDNVNIPVFSSNATGYRIVATTPAFYPTTITNTGADFEDCDFNSDTVLWWIGSPNSSYSEFAPSGFANGDVYYAQDNPTAGIDEASSLFPKEINNDWMVDQYIRFTADQSGDANIELPIGAILDGYFVVVSGTLQLRASAWTTNGWLDLGDRVVAPSSPFVTWDIPDLTWMSGTDINVIRLHVVRQDEGGQSVTNSYAYYDYLYLRQRSGRGDSSAFPAVLYDDTTTKVETVWIDFWWRHPRQMKVSVVGGGTINTSQYMRIIRRVPGTASWSEVFVLYEDGNARIIPSPPVNLGGVPYGASVILGVTTNSPRPCVGIDEVSVDPKDLSLDVKYQDGSTAHVELRVDREMHVVDVTPSPGRNTSNALTRFRSMWVTDGKADIDRVRVEEGVFPILNIWRRFAGNWWQFFKQVPSYHNTYCPDFRIELLGDNAGFLSREAESLDSGSNYVIQSSRTNASGGQSVALATNGGDAVFSVSLAESKPSAWMRLRYSDGDEKSTTIRVIVDGVRTASTYSVNTGGSNEFELTPSVSLGDLSSGNHTLRIQTAVSRKGIELDWFELVSQPADGGAAKSLVTRQGETWTWGQNLTYATRPNAVSGATVHLEHTGTASAVAAYNVVIPIAVTGGYLRIRCGDDIGPNQLKVYLNNRLRGRFPSEDTSPGVGSWSWTSNAWPFFLGPLTAGTYEVKFVSSNQTYGVDLDEFEIYSVNHHPSLNLADVHVLPVGSSTGFVVTATDCDGDALILTNVSAPAGSAFVTNWFSWAAAAGDEATTSRVYFVANDLQGLSNSVVTNTASIVVPYDSDVDQLGDGWEWMWFTTLTNTALSDSDADGLDNYSEYVADTSPTDAVSSFVVGNSIESGGQTNHLITVDTRPGRKYTILFKDWILSNDVPWASFASTNRGVWIETGTVSGTHTFIDDEGTDTSAGGPLKGARFYRVKVKKP
jgi:hypothetical protein